jgi:hypothetical protein
MKPAIPFLMAALAASFTVTRAEDPRIPEIPASDFDRLLGLIKPLPGESPWREIEWLTDVTEARSRSVAEDKPLVIFTAADGSPLGRT